MCSDIEHKYLLNSRWICQEFFANDSASKFNMLHTDAVEIKQRPKYHTHEKPVIWQLGDKSFYCSFQLTNCAYGHIDFWGHSFQFSNLANLLDIFDVFR